MVVVDEHQVIILSVGYEWGGCGQRLGKYQTGLYSSKEPGVQVGHSIAGIGRQVPGQQHTAAHELVVCQVISPVAGAHANGFH